MPMDETKRIKDYLQTELEHLIKENVIGLHASRNRKIIRDKLFKGLSIVEISKKYDLSQTRVKTIIRTFRQKIDG